MEQVYKFIDSLNIKSEYVVAAISGGPDSMFLLEVLKKFNFKIVVCHVHHNHRIESDNEALMVEEYCKKNNMIFEFMKIEKYTYDTFTEVEAREKRYKFFDEIVKKYNSDILFTAHHGDDLIETVLMRLTRGSSLKGYAGFEPISIREGYKIARPLIFLTKQEIVDYLDKKEIKYAVDMSNKCNDYTRNRYRNKILPLLKEENENVHLKFIDYNKKILLADSYLKKVSDKYISDKIDVTEFNKLDDIIKLYVVEGYLKNVYNEDITEIGNNHIYTIIDLIKNTKNCSIDLPLNKKGILEYNIFRVEDNKESIEFDITFDEYAELPNGKRIFIDNNTELTNNFVTHLNSSEIKFPLHVRTRKDGDSMKILNMNGTKKVSDILIDSKVPNSKRDEIPIVTDDNGEIIWIPGIKKSHFDRLKVGKYDIIFKYN